MAENTKDTEVIDFWESPTGSKKEDKKVNIFDDFGGDKNLETEVAKDMEKENKDLFFYATIASKVFQIGFFILLFLVLVWWVYIFIQKNESLNSQSFLDPVCGIFVGDVPNPEGSCPSITYAHSYYETKLEEVKKEQTGKILEVLPNVYANKNFENTKEVSFLLDKAEDRLQVLDILSEFDTLKNDFTGYNKNKVTCRSFTIDRGTMTLSASCSAYSKGYESSIKWFSWDEKNIRGTSISVANSFLNFIEKKSTYFSLLNRQKTFDSETLVDSSSGYTKVTNFELTLKINN